MSVNKITCSPFSNPPADNPVPFDQRPPNFYLRIANIVIPSLSSPQGAPPAKRMCKPVLHLTEPSCLPSITASLSSKKEPLRSIPDHVIRTLQSRQMHQCQERAEQLRENPTEADEVVTPTRLETQHYLGNLICNAVSTIMNRGKDPDQGVWYPNERQKLLELQGRALPFDSLRGEISTEYFVKEITEDGDTTFTLRAGKKPSDGVKSFFKGPTIASCGMACLACGYKALMNFYGTEKFDSLFSEENPLIIEDALSEEFFEETATRKKILQGCYGNRPAQIGDICRFENVPWYKIKHPGGCGDGLNCVYMDVNASGAQVFGGLGLSRLLTEGEIYQWMLEDYNQERTPLDWKLIGTLGSPESFDVRYNPTLRDCYTIDASNPEQLEQLGLVSFYPEGSFRVRSIDDRNATDEQGSSME